MENTIRGERLGEEIERKTGSTLVRNIILLGAVSFLTDASSEMMMPLLPFFITSLGGTALAVGFISGFGGAVASLLKVFSGYWSDRFGNKKRFVLAGYGISVLSKVGIAFSRLWWGAGLLYPLERTGKGIRTAPRDALIAESCDEGVRGNWFGVHRAMDTAGAILGSALAFVLLWVFGFSYRTIFLIAILPAAAAIIPLLFLRERKGNSEQAPGLRINISSLPHPLLKFICVATIFGMANFSYMLFILAAGDVLTRFELPISPIAAALLLYIFFNIIYTLLAIPFGRLSDRIGKKKVIGAGYGLFAASCLLLMLAGLLEAPLTPTLLLMTGGFGAYGCFFAMIEGNQRALISDLAPATLRGTALGTFHTAIGLAAIPAGLIAGLLWNRFGAWSAFAWGGVVALAALVALALLAASSPAKIINGAQQ